VSAFTNLGYIQLVKGFPAEAIRLYNLALKLDPDYEPLLLNLAGYFAFNKNYIQAKLYLEKILKKNPTNVKAKQALHQIKALI
jgi:Tfp pilus assembly protein PilF